jgi:hypothetical protein
MNLALAPPEPYLTDYLYILLLFIVNINLHVGDDVHPHGMSHRWPSEQLKLVTPFDLEGTAHDVVDRRGRRSVHPWTHPYVTAV